MKEGAGRGSWSGIWGGNRGRPKYIRGLQKFIRIFADDFADRNFKLYIIKKFLGAFDQQNYQQLLQQKKSC